MLLFAWVVYKRGRKVPSQPHMQIWEWMRREEPIKDLCSHHHSIVDSMIHTGIHSFIADQLPINHRLLLQGWPFLSISRYARHPFIHGLPPSLLCSAGWHPPKVLSHLIEGARAIFFFFFWSWRGLLDRCRYSIQTVRDIQWGIYLNDRRTDRLVGYFISHSIPGPRGNGSGPRRCIACCIHCLPRRALPSRHDDVHDPLYTHTNTNTNEWMNASWHHPSAFFFLPQSYVPAEDWLTDSQVIREWMVGWLLLVRLLFLYNNAFVKASQVKVSFTSIRNYITMYLKPPSILRC